MDNFPGDASPLAEVKLSDDFSLVVGQPIDHDKMDAYMDKTGNYEAFAVYHPSKMTTYRDDPKVLSIWLNGQNKIEALKYGL